MRLLVSSIILVITGLDFRFGEPGNAQQVASLCAGLLLALTVVADHFWPGRRTPDPPPAAEPEATVDPTAP
jgi:hypothetical protein